MKRRRKAMALGPAGQRRRPSSGPWFGSKRSEPYIIRRKRDGTLVYRWEKAEGSEPKKNHEVNPEVRKRLAEENAQRRELSYVLNHGKWRKAGKRRRSGSIVPIYIGILESNRRKH